ncbi:MAG: toxin-antitoxin system HicB family antitoxin [Deferrisomatales bacterium]|nr:toxin-antitoxin system HicB family antitoxin [Deferrisomatales bacterium]
MKKVSDRYLKIVEWSEEDGCYVGTCPELVYGGVHGDDEAAVYAELCRVAEEAVELYGKDCKPLPPATAGKAYSGRFVLRVPPEIHRTLAIRALQRGKSLNAYCQEVLRSAVR